MKPDHKNRMPEDPVILASYINMKLRDGCISLQEFCDENDIERDKLEEKLAAAGFRYDEKTNQIR